MLSIGPVSSLPISSSIATVAGEEDPEIDNYSLTFSLFSNSAYTDWTEEAGPAADYNSYLETYFVIADDPMAKFQSPYVYVFVDSGAQLDVVDSDGSEVIDSSSADVVTDTVSLILNTYWDWADTEEESIVVTLAGVTIIDSASSIVVDHTTSVRSSRDIQVYRFRNGYPVSVSKNKVSGKGKALQLRFTSESGKDFNLLGWAGWISKNATY